MLGFIDEEEKKKNTLIDKRHVKFGTSKMKEKKIERIFKQKKLMVGDL